MWTLPELVAEAGQHIERLPQQTNGQVRAVPDERTVRYYVTLGLLDRPASMRGRTALYDKRHLAQVIAIKRLQGAGRSLAEIQALWATLDDVTLSRMAGIELPRSPPTQREFWKKPPAAPPPPTPAPAPAPAPSVEPAAVVELRLELAPGVAVVIAMDHFPFSGADIRAVRAAAQPLLDELKKLEENV